MELHAFYFLAEVSEVFFLVNYTFHTTEEPLEGQLTVVNSAYKF